MSVVRQERSDIPAVTHVDYSARVQTIRREDHPAYYELIRAFEEKTGCAVIINTSFNVNGEPIVCTPYDAYRCFMRTEMDALILGNFLLIKTEQPQWTEAKRQIAEHDDALEQAVNNRFIKALRRIYVNEFLPIASSLRKQGLVQVSTAFERVPSTWQDFTADQSPESIFPIPAAIDASDARPRRNGRINNPVLDSRPRHDCPTTDACETHQTGSRVPDGGRVGGRSA